MEDNKEYLENEEVEVEEVEETEKKAPQRKLWNNPLFLALAIFLMAPLGVVWMWVDKGFTYKKSTKLIVTILILLAGAGTVMLRNSAIAKYPELKGQPNTVIIQKVLEK